MFGAGVRAAGRGGVGDRAGGQLRHTHPSPGSSTQCVMLPNVFSSGSVPGECDIREMSMSVAVLL